MSKTYSVVSWGHSGRRKPSDLPMPNLTRGLKLAELHRDRNKSQGQGGYIFGNLRKAHIHQFKSLTYKPGWQIVHC